MFRLTCLKHRLALWCLALCCARAVPGLTATITVTSTADSGVGTLRAPLANASNRDTINFSLTMPAIITLTSGELLVSKSLKIIGPGANNLAIDGNDASRVFHIGSNAAVTIASVTITNG